MTPKKTIYIKAEDAELWRKAELYAHASISSLLADLVRQYVKECESAGQEPIRRALSKFLREQAEWREYVAQDYPDDMRNLRAASGLRVLADYVTALPEGDDRLQRLAPWMVGEDLMLPPVAEMALKQWWFHNILASPTAEGCSDEVDHIVKVAEEEELNNPDREHLDDEDED